MRFVRTNVEGAFVLDVEPHRDHRGFFARIHDGREFAEHGLDARIAQTSIAYNERRGTLRGLHLQAAPYAESKVIRCLRGVIHVVAADLRPTSPSYLRHVAVELSQENRRALYIPEGCASGYQTLTDDAELLYEITVPYAPDHQRGVHHADPDLAISWPLRVTAISDRDAALPPLGLRRIKQSTLTLGGAS